MSGDGVRGVVDAECGGSNALVGFGQRLMQDRRLQQWDGAASSSHQQLSAWQLSDEYMCSMAAKAAAPTSFRMASLITQLPDHQREAARWSEQFASVAQPHEAAAAQWTQQYGSAAQQTAAAAGPGLTTWHGHQPYQPMLRPAPHSASSCASLAGSLASGGQQWSSDYLHQFDQSSSSSRQTSVDEQAKAWADQYASQREAKTEDAPDYWDSLQAQWDGMEPTGDYDWLQQGNSIYDEYVSEPSNPYLEAADPVAEGERLLALGDLSNAILHFEAATHSNEQDAKAWRLLGIAQSENECESKAIAALRRSLALEPRSQDTLFALAVAYTNECLYNDAMHSMAAWLDSDASYSQFVDPSMLTKNKHNANSYTSFMDRSLFERIERAYLLAAGSQPGSIDAPLQNSLGVLYNISGNFERAVDSFQTALHVDGENARTWNRLGATLANSSSERTADAVNAYSRALELYPGFVRARCNLAISCLHLKAYPQAVEHFIGALQLQSRGLGPTKEKSMSDSIWQSMRMAALHLPESTAMLTAIQARDLAQVQRIMGTAAPAAGQPQPQP